MKSILVADSGSTKTAWSLLMTNGETYTFYGTGINPYMLSQKNIEELLEKELLPHIQKMETGISYVYFYGAGCRGGVESDSVKNAIKAICREAEVFVSSDLLGAAHALFHASKGIACILGTGSASCLYDGENIVKNTPSLGYILGDEGSGAVIGKSLVNELFKGHLPSDIYQTFLNECPGGVSDVLRRVYKEPFPNRFLASLVSKVVVPHRQNPAMQTLLKQEFRKFFERNISHYSTVSIPIAFVGGVAYGFEEELREIAEECGYEVSVVLKEPMEGLVKMYRLKMLTS